MLIVLGAMRKSSNYRKAYEEAKKELSHLLSEQGQFEKRLIDVRKAIQALAVLCAGQGIEVDASDEAEALLAHSTLAEEIRAVLQARYPTYLRPHWVKAELQRLGHDLSNYRNPQASIQMVLKRMVDSGDVEERTKEDKKEYRKSPPAWVTYKDMKRIAESEKILAHNAHLPSGKAKQK